MLTTLSPYKISNVDIMSYDECNCGKLKHKVHNTKQKKEFYNHTGGQEWMNTHCCLVVTDLFRVNHGSSTFWAFLPVDVFLKDELPREQFLGWNLADHNEERDSDLFNVYG